MMYIPDVTRAGSLQYMEDDSVNFIEDNIVLDDKSRQEMYYRIGMGDLVSMQKAKNNIPVLNHSTTDYLFTKDSFTVLYDWLNDIDNLFQWIDDLLTGKLFIPKLKLQKYI